MIVYSCYYTLPGDPLRRYERMANVLCYSARKHLGFANIGSKVERIEPEEGLVKRRHGRGLGTNTDKLRQWVSFLSHVYDGTRLAFLDADTVITSGRLAEIWLQDFDVAITAKRDTDLPINGGAVYLRVNERSREFMNRWLDVNEWLYANPAKHAPWRRKYGGMNQAALGYLLEHPLHATALYSARVVEVPCRRWNCCHTGVWPHWKDAYLVHIKSQLRTAVFAQRPVIARHHRGYADFVDYWRDLEKEASNVR